MPDYELSFAIDGIGPHHDENKIPKKSFTKKSINVAIYAENGTGKTFISRSFALNENIRNLTNYDTDNLISLGKNTGSFTFTVKNNGKIIHEYSVKLKSRDIPELKNTGDKEYIYHVFNSDYIENNIAERNYSPDDDIKGYIIGKTNIDISSERDSLKSKEQLINILTKKIESKMEQALDELKSIGISSNLTEFKNINLESILSQKHLEHTESYDVLSEQYNRLKNIPDEIPVLALNFPTIDYPVLNEANRILTTKYDRAHFDNKVMDTIKNIRTDKAFFETGLQLYDKQHENICPFCHNVIDNNAMYYLNLYREYFSQAESQAISEIDKIISTIEKLKEDIEEIHVTFNELVVNFENYKTYIPEFSNTRSLKLISPKEIINSLKQVSHYLSEKKDNIENTNFDILSILEQFDTYISQAKKIFEDQFTMVNSLQNSLSDTNASRKKLCRQICKVRHNMLIDDCGTSVEELNKIENEIAELRNSISKKVRKSRTEKREIVKDDLKKLLDYFFHNKYTLDDETFSITFMNQNLNEKAKHVLSDGEKSILAFCYFLATTHTLIDSESDYDDLFFIFDDPISSMDFKYVYAVVDVLRGLKNYFPQIKDKPKYIVLTHNAEFMSMLCRNKIVSLKLYLRPGNIDKLKDELVMPYEHHLHDISQIANYKQNPNHTTPNSIRQVIETIMRFEIPRETSLEKYVRDNEILNKNADIYSLMQDGSHGIFLKQPPITNEDLIEACQVVEKFVKNKYPKQLDMN